MSISIQVCLKNKNKKQLINDILHFWDAPVVNAMFQSLQCEEKHWHIEVD